ncbi:MAG: recombinase family protein [Candidatus Dependentiae bacterium]
MKAILIARVSTEEQREAGNSLPAQIARLERYCEQKGYPILNICSFDESAYSLERSEFDRIIDLILSQKEKVIVCCDKVDRLSRNVFDKRISLLYEKALCDQIELHFVSEGQVINSRISATEKFQFNISLGLAKYYSDAISDNVRRANEQKLRKGELPGKAPLGYKNIKTPDGKKDIIIDDHKAYIVQKAFELYGTGVYSMDLLRAKLKEDYNVTWSKGFTDHILKNHFYYGVMERNDKFYPHRYPPLIPKTLFDRVQEVKASYKKKPAKFAGLPYIYRGMFRCATCGLAITPEKHKGFVYYHCTQYNGKHGAAWLREETITEKLSQVFKNLQMPANVAATIKQTLDEVHQYKMDFQTKQYKELTGQHQSLTKMMDNLYLDKLKGRITESAYDKFYQSFRDQLAEVTLKLERLQEAEDNYYITAKYILDLTNHAYDIFKSSEVTEKRQLIKLVLSNLQVDGENIVYEAQKPFDLILNCSERQTWCA